MRDVIDRTPTSVSEIVRDNHDESGVYSFFTKIFNDPQLEKNKRVRLEGVVNRNQKNPFIEGGAQYAFSINPVEWSIFKRDHKDIYKALKSRDEKIRFHAAMQIQLLHPEWVIMAGNK